MANMLTAIKPHQVSRDLKGYSVMFYGTPKSRSFVNGLLDKLVQQLANEGQIKKEGKGLL